MPNQVIVMEKESKRNGFVHAVYEESPYGIIVFNSALEIVDWNPAVEKLIGLDKDACIGKYMLDVFPQNEEMNGNMLAPTEVKGTMVVAEAVAGYFVNGILNGIKISTIVDKSGAINGGTLILTPRHVQN